MTEEKENNEGDVGYDTERVLYETFQAFSFATGDHTFLQSFAIPKVASHSVKQYEAANKQASPSPTPDTLWNRDTGRDYYMTVNHIESGGRSRAKASTSSAYGPFQFTEGTWNRYVKKIGKDYSLEDRADYGKALEVMQAFTEDNRRILTSSLRRPVTNMELYTAHFLGPQGAVKFLQADDNENASKILTRAALSNKAVFKTKTGRDRTVGEIKELIARKYWSYNGKKRSI